MVYIAQKRMKIGHDEKRDIPMYAQHGDVVDVSDWSWQTVSQYERSGYLKERADVPERAAEHEAPTIPPRQSIAPRVVPKGR